MWMIAQAGTGLMLVRWQWLGICYVNDRSPTATSGNVRCSVAVLARLRHAGAGQQAIGNAKDLDPVFRYRREADWLAVRSSSVTGWVRRADVVSLNEAVAYFDSQEIAANPENLAAYPLGGHRPEGAGRTGANADHDYVVERDPNPAAAYVEDRGNAWPAKAALTKPWPVPEQAIQHDPKFLAAYNKIFALVAGHATGEVAATASAPWRQPPRPVS